MSERDPFTTFDAPYVLGALSPEGRAAYEEHLPTCPACSASVRELAGMPGLLSQAPTDPPWPEPPPATLLPTLLDRVSRARRRLRIAAVAAAGVALAACLALLFVAFSSGGQDPGGATSDEIAMTSLVDYPVEATVSLSETDGGTQVEMDCRYGIDDANEYVLVALTQDGEATQLASWLTTPDRVISLNMGTELQRADIETVEIRSTHGYPVLRADVD